MSIVFEGFLLKSTVALFQRKAKDDSKKNTKRQSVQTFMTVLYTLE